MMPIEHINDWELRIARQDAFWNCAIIDRPVVAYTVPKSKPALSWPLPKEGISMRERWMDVEYLVDSTLAGVANTEYGGDALPHAWPNLGPEIFSAFFGCELEYGEHTSWSIPCLHNWDEVNKLQFSMDNFYWKQLEAMTDALLDAGSGKYYVGITDLHPGGDAIAAFRDPVNLNLDMLDVEDEVKALLHRVNQVYFQVYDYYCDKLEAAGQAISTWTGMISSKRWYLPSNDFSCMVSKRMYDEVFLPGIIAECQHTGASIYHLDGPTALQHLDSLLSIKELNAIQWTYGAGNGRASDWMDVYKKCQAAGKGLEIHLEIDEIDYFMESLKPEGLWIGLIGVQDSEHGKALVKKLSQWK